MLFFQLEKSIACARSGSAQGPKHRQAGEERAEASGGRKGGSEGNAVIISQQLCDHQIDYQAKVDKLLKDQRSLQSLFQQIGIYLLNSRVSTIQILQTSSHPHNSMLFCWVPAKGPEARAAFSPPEISRQLKEGSEPRGEPLMWFLFDPCRNHAV